MPVCGSMKAGFKGAPCPTVKAILLGRSIKTYESIALCQMLNASFDFGWLKRGRPPMERGENSMQNSRSIRWSIFK